MPERINHADVVRGNGPPPLDRRAELAVVARMAHLANRVCSAFLMSCMFVGLGVFTTAIELHVVFDHFMAMLVVAAVGVLLLMLSILLFSPWSFLILAVWMLTLTAGGINILYFYHPRDASSILGLASTSFLSLVCSVVAFVIYWRLKTVLGKSRLSWSECRRMAMYWFAFGHRGWSGAQIWPRPWLTTPEKTVRVYFTLHNEEMIVFVGRDRDLGTNMWFSGRDPANFTPCPAEAERAAFVVTFTDTTGTLLVSADEGEMIRAWVERRFPPTETLSSSGYLEFRAMALDYGRKAVSAKA